MKTKSLSLLVGMLVLLALFGLSTGMAEETERLESPRFLNYRSN